MDPEPSLRELAARRGVDTTYVDWRGRQQVVSDDTLRAVLGALDADVNAVPPVLPPCLVLRAGSPRHVPAVVASARLELEDGTELTAAIEPDGIALPADLPLGYHRLVAQSAGTTHATHLIVVPERAPWPQRMTEPGWGFAVQLYSVTSCDSWGTGDLGDLRALATWSAREHGADFVLVNPLHAAEVRPPLTDSPYLPTSRRFANPAYLRVADIPECDPAAIAGRAPSGAGELIDRDASWTAKVTALERVYASGRSATRENEFAAFVVAEGDALHRFATWCALSERYGSDWTAWPAELQDPASAQADPARVRFFCWLQWVLEEQLARTQDDAVAAGMRIGVLHDLAVGVNPRGADAWSYRDVLASGVSVGAPPDDYSQLGQDWEQPPWRPDRLAELGYAPLRELFRAMLRHAGGLRVDHIIGLFRLWWIPAGQPALAGTYVHYDHEAIIGILLLEAHRAGAVLVGEDLGNVEPWVHTYLHERGVLGTSILWFESDEHGAPLPAQRWRRDCLASVTTHDIPPTTGYLAGEHVHLRDRLGLLTRPAAAELTAHEAAKQAWLDELIRAGVLAPPDAADEHRVVVALHRYLTRTPSRLRCVALTDAVGERRTQNQPGTRADQHPNWRVPLAGPDGRRCTLEDVFTSPAVDEVIAAVDAASTPRG